MLTTTQENPYAACYLLHILLDFKYCTVTNVTVFSGLVHIIKVCASLLW